MSDKIAPIVVGLLFFFFTFLLSIFEFIIIILQNTSFRYGAFFFFLGTKKFHIQKLPFPSYEYELAV